MRSPQDPLPFMFIVGLESVLWVFIYSGIKAIQHRDIMFNYEVTFIHLKKTNINNNQGNQLMALTYSDAYMSVEVLSDT